MLGRDCKRDTRQICHGQPVLNKRCVRMRVFGLFLYETALVMVLGEHVGVWQHKDNISSNNAYFQTHNYSNAITISCLFDNRKT